MKKNIFLLLIIAVSIFPNSVRKGSLSKAPQKKTFGNGLLYGTVRHKGVRSYADIYITDLNEKKVYGHFYYSPKLWKQNDFKFSGLPTNKKLLAIAFAKTHMTNQLFFSGATPFTIKENSSSNITIDLKPILEGNTGMSTGSRQKDGGILFLVAETMGVILHYIELKDNKTAMSKAQLQISDLEILRKQLYSISPDKTNINKKSTNKQRIELGLYTGLSFFPSSFPSHSITIQPDGANYKGYFTQCAFCRKAGKSFPLKNIKVKAGKISFIAGPYTFEGKIIKDYFEGTLFNGEIREPFGFAPGGPKELPWNFGDF